MRTFVAHHKSPINEYDYLAVDTGARPAPAVVLWEGRQCYVSGQTRVHRAHQGRTAYNSLVLTFLDGSPAVRVTATEFNKKAQNAPLPA